MLIKTAINVVCMALLTKVSQAATLSGTPKFDVSASEENKCLPPGPPGDFPEKNIHLKWGDSNGPDGQFGHFHGDLEGIWFNAFTESTIEHPTSVDINVWNPSNKQMTFWIGSHVKNGTADSVTKVVLKANSGDDNTGRATDHYCFQIKEGTFGIGVRQVWAVAIS